MPHGNIFRGMFKLAAGNASGIREFGNTPAAFSASIAPLLAFPLVGSTLFALEGHWLLALSIFLSRVCGILVQPAIVESTARRTGNRATWLVTSTALNWSVWLVFPLIFAGVLVSNGLVSAGMSETAAIVTSVCLIVAYGLWLQWFILRVGLRVSGWVALAALLVMNITTASLYIIPYAYHPGLLKLTLNPAAG